MLSVWHYRRCSSWRRRDRPMARMDKTLTRCFRTCAKSHGESLWHMKVSALKSSIAFGDQKLFLLQSLGPYARYMFA